MATFVLVHGAGDGGWYWHLVEPRLTAQGHDVVAPDLPAEAPATLADFTGAVTGAVTAAVGDAPSRPVVVVAQSFGGFTAPLVVDRLGADVLVFVTAMVPAPGESPDDWWERTGYSAAVAAAREKDAGLADHGDPIVSFYNGVPPEIAEEALRRERNHPPDELPEPWPLPALPAVPTHFVLCTEDRFFPADFARRVVAERLPGVVPDEIASGHCPALARPEELAGLLLGYAAATGD
jgi:hypothetical protein